MYVVTTINHDMGPISWPDRPELAPVVGGLVGLVGLVAIVARHRRPKLHRQLRRQVIFPARTSLLEHRPRPIPDLGDDRSEVGHIGQIGSGGHVVILATIALIVGRICIGSGGRSGRPRSSRPVSGPGPPPEPIERVRQGRAGPGRAGPGRTKLLMQRSSATGATTGIGERDNMLPMATEETPGLNSLNCRALSCGPPLTLILPFLDDFFVLDRPQT